MYTTDPHHRSKSNSPPWAAPFHLFLHGRKTEEKAKVVTSDWGEEFLAALAVLPRTILNNRNWDELHQDDLKEKDEFILFFTIVPGKIASLARKLINASPQTGKRPWRNY